MGDAVKPALHGRDHCPGGTDPIPCLQWYRFRARRKTTFQTLGSSGAETDLTWNYHENDNPNIWTAIDTGGSPVTGTTDTVRGVILQVPALVVMGGCISVEPIAVGTDTQLVIIINDDFDNPELVVHAKQIAGAGGDYSFTSIRSYPTLEEVGDPTFSIDAAQNGGTNRNTRFGTYWELAAWPL